MKKETHQPHDKLVKRLLSKPDAARDILSLYLPKEVLKLVDLNHLELQRDSFIDDEHRAFAVDLLYETSIQGEKAYIWLLIEHQRTDTPWMPVRLFKYIGIIWDHLSKISKTKKIPFIFPLVLYNGDKPYTHSLTLSDLIEPASARELFADMFTKPFSLVDLAAMPDEELRKEAQDKVKGIALLMALKHSFHRDLQSFFEQVFVNVLKHLDKTGGADDVVDIVYYLLNEGKFLDTRQFLDALHGAISLETEGKIMTIAQQLENRGIEKRNREIAKQLLAEKTGLNDSDLIALIKRLTGLSEDKIQELRKNH